MRTYTQSKRFRLRTEAPIFPQDLSLTCYSEGVGYHFVARLEFFDGLWHFYLTQYKIKVNVGWTEPAAVAGEVFLLWLGAVDK